jgi:hypothetical protein
LVNHHLKNGGVHAPALLLTGGPSSSEDSSERLAELPRPLRPGIIGTSFAAAEEAVGDLRGSLYAWRCGPEGLAMRERRRGTKAAMADAGMLRRKRVEAVGEARVCRDDWETDLPDLRTVAKLESARWPKPKAKKPKQPQQQGEDVPVKNATDTAAEDDPRPVTFIMPVIWTSLGALEEQCRLWRGHPLSAAVYFPQHSAPKRGGRLDDALASAIALHRDMEAAGPEGACALSLEVFAEYVCEEEEEEERKESRVPLGALKNRALRTAATEAILVSNGQYLVHQYLSAMLDDPGLRGSLMAAVRSTDFAGVVLPTVAPSRAWPLLERVAPQLAAEVARQPKTMVVGSVKLGQLDGLGDWELSKEEVQKFWEDWAPAKGEGLKKVDLMAGTSPHAIVLSSRVPWFDERLRGEEELAATLQARHTIGMLVAAGESSGSNFNAVRGDRLRWAVLPKTFAVRMSPQPALQQRRRLLAEAASLAEGSNHNGSSSNNSSSVASSDDAGGKKANDVEAATTAPVPTPMQTHQNVQDSTAANARRQALLSVYETALEEMAGRQYVPVTSMEATCYEGKGVGVR